MTHRYAERLAARKPGTYNVFWCDGARVNIPSVREAMAVARRSSSKRFATETCGGSTVSHNVSTTSAQTVAECSERGCTPFKSMSARDMYAAHSWTPAKETAAYKRQRGLGRSRRRRR